jgi:hypothetical protein
VKIDVETFTGHVFAFQKRAIFICLALIIMAMISVSDAAYFTLYARYVDYVKNL